jgi:glycosyltransferase involved in cell wall biosynthesis
VRRVLLVHQPIDGGVARHIGDLAAGLAERSFEVILCSPAPPCDALPGGVRHLELQLQRAVSPGQDLLAIRRLGEIVRAVKPDLIHAHSSKAGAVARAWRLLHPRTPVLYTPHGYSFAGHFTSNAERRAYREAERIMAPLTSRVLSVCGAEARLARSIGPANRVRVVHNGIDPIADGPVDMRMRELAQRGPVACAVTLLRPGKGLETLIDAMPATLAACPDAQVAIVGDGPDMQALARRASDRGVGQAIHFLGAIADPVSVMREADLLVHPSWAEAFPYVILEAMSVGLPIVASDVGGISEAVSDGNSGLLVPRADSSRLAAALSELLGDPALRRKMSQNGRRIQQTSFTRGAMVDGVVAVYDEVLAHASSFRAPQAT